MTTSRVLAGLTAAAATAAVLAGTTTPTSAAAPDLQVEVVKAGLQHPWDVAPLPGGALLYTERDRKRVHLLTAGGQDRVVLDSPAGMVNRGETGLMAVEPDADFDRTRTFFTCHGTRSGSGAYDVRVVRWKLDAALTRVSSRKTLVPGLPATSGRHGGCALARVENLLYVGTGDAASGGTPQSLTSGGGKVLRVDALTGAGVSANRWAGSSNAMKRRVFTYGHRNVQGLSLGLNGRMWSVEQGSYRDDEANRLVKGGNYGWDPRPRRSGDPSYNEGANSPMTDTSLPGAQVLAAWRSGSSTLATSGATFLRSSRWGTWRGALVVATLKDQSLRVLPVRANDTVGAVATPPALDGTYGRLRAAAEGPDGTLWVTTSNGSDDKLLRVTPAAP